MEYTLIWEKDNNRFEESFSNISDLEIRISFLNFDFDTIQILDTEGNEWYVVLTDSIKLIKGLYGKQ